MLLLRIEHYYRLSLNYKISFTVRSTLRLLTLKTLITLFTLSLETNKKRPFKLSLDYLSP